MTIARKSIATLFAGTVLAVGVASPASAQTRQNGLVNVNVEDVTVQVPVAVAANICDVTVAVLSAAIADGPTTCQAIADSQADA